MDNKSKDLYMNDDDMIYTNKNDEIYTGGYRFNNEFINKETGPFTVLQQGGSYENIFGNMLQNLAVPTGLLFLQQNLNSNTNIEKSLHSAKNDLYDSLVDMMGIKEKTKSTKRNTRKRRTSTATKRTRKQR